MKLAVIGGGKRCHLMLNMLEFQTFNHLKADVVAVVDTNPEAEGFCHAKKQGIFTTTDLDRLWDMPDLDLIVELTDDPRLVDRLRADRPESANLLGRTASQLLHDVLCLAGQLQETRDKADLAQSLTQLLIGATNEGVLLLDPDYRIIKANEAALKSAGLSDDQAVGRFCFQVSHRNLSPCHKTDTPCPMQSTLSTGRSAHAIHEHLQQDGSLVFCDVSTYPLFNSEGKVVQVLEVFRDITDDLTRRMEVRTRALRHDLARMVQEDRLISLGKLVASVSHELNNPIGSILNFTKLMEKGLNENRTDPEQMTAYLDWLKLTIQEAERVKYIVRNLLSFARQGSVSHQLVDLAEIVETTLELTEHHLELAGVEVKVETPHDQLMIEGDPHQLQQVLINLILNAMEAMDKNGRLEFSGGLSEDGSRAELTVRDNGIGIRAEHMDKIFEPFFSTKGAANGTGLGLSVVYGIVRQHRGDVEVKSRPGRGALFRLSFPIYLEDDQAGEK